MKKLVLLFLFAITTASAQKELPNVSLKSLDNKSFNIKSDFTEKDKVYVYIFWATWCAPCIQ
ncbi:MAG: TlpA family protein disulfide reductase, partial [Pedobacter sp.]